MLKREDTGIIVYSGGQYIELLYSTAQNKQIESIYRYNKEYDNYEEVPHTFSELDKIQKYLEKTSYTENIGLK